MTIKQLLFTLSGLALLAAPAGAEIGAGRWSAGINYPGAALRYFTSDKLALEARVQGDSGATVAGGRVYSYFDPTSGIHPFFGIELDKVWFDDQETKGTGYAAEVFVGGEYFFSRNLSFQMDAGPAYIALKDDVSDLSASGVEYVVNFGINCYFGGTSNEK